MAHRRLARCRRCRHEFVSHCDDAALAAEYRGAYYADADDPRIDAWAAAHRIVWDAVADQILKLHPRADSLLDIGSGTGGFLARMHVRRPGLTLAAVEPSTAARAALARRLPDLVFPVSTAEELDVIDARFDVITMLQTLEHLRDPMAACRGALRCLRPGGLLFLTVPNRRSLVVALHGHRADCHANGTHLQFFTRADLHQMLRTAGFARMQRLVNFGGGQHSAWLPAMMQYALRVAGWSSELRMIAWR